MASTVEIPSYAEDVTVSATSTSISTSVSVVSKAVCAIGHDLESRGLTINVGKSSAMFITPGSSDCSEIHISFDSVKLNTVLSTKLLGVMIDNKLLWYA